MCKKLTQEVFTRPDCPKWANWAAVDSDGIAYWYNEKPKLSHCGTFWVPEDYAPKRACITGKFSGTLDLIKRKQSQTNLEWLCKHPKELAKKLIRFDDRMEMFFAPDHKVFCLYDCDADTFIFDGFDQTERRCIEYTVNWLKQEHKENNDDQKQNE